MNQAKNHSAIIASLSEAICASLSDDLLQPKYRKGRCVSTSHLSGHCSVASEALYFMLKEQGIASKPMNIKHEAVSHWWICLEDGTDIDLTAEQFETPVAYHKGTGQGFPTPKQGLDYQPPSKRAKILMARAEAFIQVQEAA